MSASKQNPIQTSHYPLIEKKKDYIISNIISPKIKLKNINFIQIFQILDNFIYIYIYM